MVQLRPYGNIDNVFTLSNLHISNKKVKGISYSVNRKYSTSSYSNNNSQGCPSNTLNPYYLLGFIDVKDVLILLFIKTVN